MTNITVRIDDDVKRDAETLFGKLGLTVSGAINVFFRQAIREQAIPFQVRVPDSRRVASDEEVSTASSYVLAEHIEAYRELAKYDSD
jgi:DNA-damage-inducible protein J